MSKVMRLKILLLIFVCCVLLASWNLMRWRTKQGTILVTIPPGSTAQEIGSRLHKAGLLGNEKWFLILVRLRKAPNRLRAGVYDFKTGRSYWGIISDLLAGHTHRIRVTVPEGFASWQVAGRLKALGVCVEEDFLDVVGRVEAEGYLFPETYFFELETSPEKIVEVMMEQFRVAFAEVLRDVQKDGFGVWREGESPGFKKGTFHFKDGRVFTGHQVVTLASIVEREARAENERPIVSAVFHNRLKKRWLLESCATVQYAMGEWKKRLRYKDLSVESPYNTYIHPGLPPGPICNPGRFSLRASLSPVNSKVLYFLADGQGTHFFYTNYSEHIKGKKAKKRMRLKG